MKSGESFQLSESWWKAGKPAVLNDTGLSGALRAFDAADHKFQSAKTGVNYVGVMSALDGVESARTATIQKCGNNPILKDVKAALAKDGAIKQRKAILTQAMQPVIEAPLAKQEAELADETRLANTYEAQVKALETKIEAARKAGNESELKKLGKQLTSVYVNVENLGSGLVFDKANALAAKCGPAMAAPYFKDFGDRLRAVKAGSTANNQKIRAIRAVVNSHPDILGDDVK